MEQEQVYDALVAATEKVDPAQATWEEMKPVILEEARVSSEDEDPVVHQVVCTLEQGTDSEWREILGNRDGIWRIVSDSAAAVEPEPGAPERYEEPAAAETATADVGAEKTEQLTVEEMANELYQSVVAQMISDNPDFGPQLEADSALAQELYAQAWERVQQRV